MKVFVQVFFSITLIASLITATPAMAQKPKAVTPNLALLTNTTAPPNQPTVNLLTEGNKKVVRLGEKPGGGVAYLPDVQFTNGIIEFDVKGKDALQKSFVGIAFHGTNDSTYNAIYFRPFNFRSSDPVRKSHSVQYISAPLYHWERLRVEFPDKYENAIASAPDPNEWFHVKVEVASPTIRVFVNNAQEPSLVVNQIGDQPGKQLGFWVGNGSSGDFANLKITPVR